MKLEFWVQLLINGLLIAPLAWVCTQVYGMNRDVGEVRTDVRALTNRVDAVVAVLPEAHVRVAKDELLYQHVAAIVLTARPTPTSSGLRASVQLIVPGSSSRQVYEFQLSGKDPNTWRQLIMGMVTEREEFSTSLQRLASWSATDLSQPVSMPAVFDPQASYVLRNPESVKFIRKQLEHSGRVKIVTYSGTFNTSAEFLAHLSRDPDEYTRLEPQEELRKAPSEAGDH